jgi:hypothetical protein
MFKKYNLYQVFLPMDLSAVWPALPSGGETISLLKKTALKERFFIAENFFLISLQQPQGRLLGDQGRGEDPFLP